MSDHVERLRVVPHLADEFAHSRWESRPAVREYPEPEDFPPVVTAFMNAFALTTFAVVIGCILLPAIVAAGQAVWACASARAC